MKIRIFTNGYYDILGIIINKKLIGICIKTLFPKVKEKWDFVVWPEYHTPNCIHPQFIRKKYYKEDVT